MNMKNTDTSRNGATSQNIPMAADSAEYLNSFLNTLGVELFKIGHKDVYSIVSDVENLILSDLAELNKSTKLTMDELKAVLSRYGTPESMAKSYELEEELYSQKIFEGENSNGLQDHALNPQFLLSKISKDNRISSYIFIAFFSYAYFMTLFVSIGIFTPYGYNGTLTIFGVAFLLVVTLLYEFLLVSKNKSNQIDRVVFKTRNYFLNIYEGTVFMFLLNLILSNYFVQYLRLFGLRLFLFLGAFPYYGDLYEANFYWEKSYFLFFTWLVPYLVFKFLINRENKYYGFFTKGYIKEQRGIRYLEKPNFFLELSFIGFYVAALLNFPNFNSSYSGSYNFSFGLIPFIFYILALIFVVRLDYKFSSRYLMYVLIWWIVIIGTVLSPFDLTIAIILFFITCAVFSYRYREFFFSVFDKFVQVLSLIKGVFKEAGW